jgi:hypothetical protein
MRSWAPDAQAEGEGIDVRVVAAHDPAPLQLTEALRDRLPREAELLGQVRRRTAAIS